MNIDPVKKLSQQELLDLREKIDQRLKELASLAPRRIDILTSIDGGSFKKAYSAREEFRIERIKIPLLSKADLIKNKASTGRAKDKLDVKELRRRH